MELLAKPVFPEGGGRRKILGGFLDGLPLSPYTSAVPEMDVNLNPEGFEPGDERGFRDVAALRTDGQGPAGGSQGEPLEYQDQAPVPAEPVQRHLHFRRAGAECAVAGFDQRDQVSRPSRRFRCVPLESQGGRTVPEGAGAEAPDRKEDGGSEGQLARSPNGFVPESFARPGRTIRPFCFSQTECPTVAAIAATLFRRHRGSTTGLRGGAESRFSKSAGSLTPPMS